MTQVPGKFVSANPKSFWCLVHTYSPGVPRQKAKQHLEAVLLFFFPLTGPSEAYHSLGIAPWQP